MQSSEVESMPRTTNESLYQQEEPVERTKAHRLKSVIKAEQKREESVDSIRLRVPKGMREQIKNHVASLPEYDTVNAWLVDLIRSQLPAQTEDDKV